MAKKKTTKKTARKRRSDPAKVRGLVVVHLVDGGSTAEAVELVAAELGPSIDDPGAFVADVQALINAAARRDLEPDLARALDELDSLHAEATARAGHSAAQQAVALNIIRERSRLLGLYGSEPDGDDSTPSNPDSDELAEIAAHLLPLELAPEDYPLSGHARIAADFIRRSKQA